MSLVRRQSKAHEAHTAGTWDCGYIRVSSRIQYTASSFASALVGLFGWVLGLRSHQVKPAGLFAANASFESHVPDLVLDRGLVPMWGRVKTRLSRLRGFQQGRIQRYLLYILLALFGLLLSLVRVGDLARRILRR
jgi:hypothetical protein